MQHHSDLDTHLGGMEVVEKAAKFLTPGVMGCDLIDITPPECAILCRIYSGRNTAKKIKTHFVGTGKK